MAKKKAAAQAEVEANGKLTNKMEGVRQTLAALGNDAKPVAMQAYLKATFDIDMDPSMISNYKGMILKKAGEKQSGKKLGRPRKDAAAPASTNGQAGHGHAVAGISLEDIKAIKALAERLGAEKLSQLAEVFG